MKLSKPKSFYTVLKKKSLRNSKKTFYILITNMEKTMAVVYECPLEFFLKAEVLITVLQRIT
jgi:hypothetical protein